MLKYYLYDKTLFIMLKKAVGLQRGTLFPVAGTPLTDNIATFLLSVNIPIIYGYGLSETSATVCCYPTKGYIVGSIGTIMPGLEVRIDEATNKILVRNKTITAGYYKKPEETKKAFTDDGFFRQRDRKSVV